MFSAQLKADSDSGVTQTKKQATWGNPLQNFGCLLQLVKLILILERPGEEKTSNKGKPQAIFWLLVSVGETDSDYGVTWTEKNKLCGGTPCNILVHQFSW